MNIDEQITQLRRLAESKGETLYEIAFRNAGVGFVWHDEKKAGPAPQVSLDDLYQYCTTMSEWTKKGLVVHRYYPTISEAITAETLRLNHKDV